MTATSISVSSGRFPVAFHLSWKRSKISVTWTHFKWLAKQWVLEHVRFCIYLLRTESCSLQPYGSFIYELHCLQDHRSWSLVLPEQQPKSGEHTVGPGPLTLRGELLQLSLSSHLWIAHLGIWWVLPILHQYRSYPSHCGSFFISLVVGNLFCQSLGRSSR